MDVDEKLVTHLLERWRDGDDRERKEAYDRLFEMLLPDLRSMARAIVSRYGAGTLNGTEVFNSRYRHMLNANIRHPTTYHALRGYMREAFKNYVLGHLRKGSRHVAEEEAPESAQTEMNPRQAATVEAAYDALKELRAVNQRQAQVFEMTNLDGMTAAEVAEELQIGTATVVRDIERARRWIRAAVGAATAEKESARA